MERPDAQQRAKWVERWKDSGLTAKEFAAEVGLKATALYSWRAQLSAAARRDSEGRNVSELPVPSRRTRSAKREKRSATPPPRFIELPVAEVTNTPAMLELLLGDVRVRVPAGFDEATLTRVVRALGAMR
jgi:transposase-like protein